MKTVITISVLSISVTQKYSNELLSDKSFVAMSLRAQEVQGNVQCAGFSAI